MAQQLAVLSTLVVLAVLPLDVTGAALTPTFPLTVGISAEPAGLDPALYDMSDNRLQITAQIVETLVTYGLNDSTPAAGLAESWSVSADGLTWFFSIRNGVTFHDGTPLSAAAVAFNLQRQWDPGHPYHNAAFEYFEAIFGGFRGDPACLITDIASPDVQTLRITLREPFSPLPSVLASPWLAIASPAAVVAGSMDQHPVGTGAFRFTSWSAGDQIRLDANTNHWRGASQIDSLTFKIIPDAAARLAALQANAIQVNADVVANQLPAIQSDARLRAVFRPSAVTWFLGINRDATAPLGNALARQAMAHALNKAGFVSGYVTPGAQLATQFVPPVIWGRDPTIIDYSYDVGQAQALLAQAGYPTGFSTTLATRATASSMPDTLAAANAIKADLAAAGIQVGVHVYDNATFRQKLNNGELELFLLGWGADYLHPANFLADVLCILYPHWFGPRDDGLCLATAQARYATSFTEQLARYQWASRRVFDTLPLIPLMHSRSIRAERREVLGIITYPAEDIYRTATYAAAWVYLPLVLR